MVYGGQGGEILAQGVPTGIGYRKSCAMRDAWDAWVLCKQTYCEARRVVRLVVRPQREGAMTKLDRYYAEKAARLDKIRQGVCPDCGGKLVPLVPGEALTSFDWFYCEGCYTHLGVGK